VGAVIVAAALALADYLAAAEQGAVAGIAAAAGASVLAAAVVLRRGTLVTVGLALVGTGYGVSLVGGGLDGAASLVAGGLILVGELAYWAIEPGAAIKIGQGATLRRGGFIVTLALGSAVLGALLLAAGSTPLEGGATLGLLGVGAVIVVAAAAVWLIHALRDPVE
jgi:hypothetical protein